MNVTRNGRPSLQSIEVSSLLVGSNIAARSSRSSSISCLTIGLLEGTYRPTKEISLQFELARGGARFLELLFSFAVGDYVQFSAVDLKAYSRQRGRSCPAVLGRAGKAPFASASPPQAPIDSLQARRSGTIWLLHHFLEVIRSIGILCSLYVFVCFSAI